MIDTPSKLIKSVVFHGLECEEDNMKSVLLILANIGFVLAELVLAPSNTVVVQGDVMKMYCVLRNDSRVRKWDIFTTNLQPFVLYLNYKLHRLFNHFGFDVDENGSGIIYTNSTNLSDAGIYKCFSVIDNVYKEHSAQLTVLEYMPTCGENFGLNSSKSSLNGDHIWMQCRVSFRGFWTPTIEWIEYGRHLGPEGRIVTHEAELTRILNRIVTSNLTIAANSSRDGSWFACRLYFAKYDGMYNMTASNFPNFTYIWNSSVIALSLSSSESVSTTIDAVVQDSQTLTRVTKDDEIERRSSADWYFISLSLVAAFSLFLIIIVVLVVVFCIRFKRKLSDKYASAVLEKAEVHVREGDYDILPYATSDNYDTIDETVIDDDRIVSFAPRKGPLPSPGYSGLTESTAPSVYSGIIDNYDTPEDIASEPGDKEVLVTLKAISDQHVDDSNETKDGKQELDVQLAVTQGPVHPYIELFDVVEANNSEEFKRTTSDFDIPSSYITVNF